MNIMGSTLMFRSSSYLFSLESRPNLSVKITKAGVSLQFGWKKRTQRRMKEEKVTAEEETASGSRRVRNQDKVMNKTRNKNRKCESEDKNRDEIKRMKQVRLHQPLPLFVSFRCYCCETVPQSGLGATFPSVSIWIFPSPVFIKTLVVFISLLSPEPCSRALRGPFEDDEWRSGATRSRNIFREVVKIAVVSAHLLLAGFRLGSNWDTSHLKDGEEIVVFLTGGGKLGWCHIVSVHIWFKRVWRSRGSPGWYCMCITLYARCLFRFSPSKNLSWTGDTGGPTVQPGLGGGLLIQRADHNPRVFVLHYTSEVLQRPVQS